MRKVTCDICLKEVDKEDLCFLGRLLGIKFCNTCYLEFQEESLKNEIIKDQMGAF